MLCFRRETGDWKVNFASLGDEYAFFRNVTVPKPFARMSGDLPVALGKYNCMDDLLNSGDMWEI